MLHLAGDLPSAFLPNYPEFPDGWAPGQLAFVEDVDEVLVAARPAVCLIQRWHFSDILMFAPAGHHSVGRASRYLARRAGGRGLADSVELPVDAGGAMADDR